MSLLRRIFSPQSFYRRLREMDPAKLAGIQMTRISFTNQLYGDEAGKKFARVSARFVNNAMMATALGAIISDGLEDGRVVSGVGGQYNFVEQAFALPGARSIIAINATRGTGKRTQSNVRWSYGHTTILVICVTSWLANTASPICAARVTRMSSPRCSASRIHGFRKICCAARKMPARSLRTTKFLPNSAATILIASELRWRRPGSEDCSRPFRSARIIRLLSNVC